MAYWQCTPVTPPLLPIVRRLQVAVLPAVMGLSLWAGLATPTLPEVRGRGRGQRGEGYERQQGCCTLPVPSPSPLPPQIGAAAMVVTGSLICTVTDGKERQPGSHAPPPLPCPDALAVWVTALGILVGVGGVVSTAQYQIWQGCGGREGRMAVLDQAGVRRMGGEDGSTRSGRGAEDGRGG